LVSAEDDELNAKRYVRATFNLVNRSTTNFTNFTLYALSKNGASIGGTGISSMTSSAGTAITTAAIARGFRPTHGMRPSIGSLKVNEDIADLQLFAPTEVDAPTTGVKQQAMALGLLGATDTVLEYGFVGRNLLGGRSIAARNTGTDCTIDACKGTLTLAYQLPKVNPRQNNPFGFTVVFVVANESVQMGSQSLEEQTLGTVMGLSSFSGYSQLRTLAGSSFQADAQQPLCRVRIATGPSLFLGPDPIPSTPGSLDLCFAASGKKIFSFADISGGDIAIQSDGKIVAIVPVQHNPLNNFLPAPMLVRFNANGSLDTAFGTAGMVPVIYVANTQSEANTIALQADGKIVVGGSNRATSQSQGLYNFAVARFNAGGTLDTTFDGDGVALLDVGSDSDSIHDIRIQSDGKIVALGRRAIPTLPIDIVVARFNSSGSPDTTFDSDGWVATNLGTTPVVSSEMAIQADGRIVVVGYRTLASNADFLLLRFNSNGSLDTGFDGDGIVTTAIGVGNDYAFGVALQSDGKIVVAGSTDNSTLDYALARYNSNGSLDTTFHNDGKTSTMVGAYSDGGKGLAIQSNGKIVVVGYSTNATTSDFSMVRYNTDGTLDSPFGNNGKVITPVQKPPSDLSSAASRVVIQSDGKILVAGNLDLFAGFALARYNP
jgi:uncharacterized delta-60 repeat protein